MGKKHRRPRKPYPENILAGRKKVTGEASSEKKKESGVASVLLKDCEYRRVDAFDESTRFEHLGFSSKRVFLLRKSLTFFAKN